MSQQEAAESLLRWAGYSEEEIEIAGGIDSAAESIGLVPVDYSAQAPCTEEAFDFMCAKAEQIRNLAQLPALDETKSLFRPVENPDSPEQPEESDESDSEDSETSEWLPEPESQEPRTAVSYAMSFQDGLAQPICDIHSEVERFCVYVETDYDTDADGKLDLIKVLVQLPVGAMNGDYRAGVIYEARPYIAGEGSHPGSSSSCAEEDLYRTAPHRTIEGTATTAQIAAQADPGDYDFYENLDWYDYFLVRGFAVVTAAGLGTRGSEGYETCGTDLEIDAFASVIEWLTDSPDAVAFTDRTGNVAVEADWSNGKVGMTGRSYAGTTQFGLAATGVPGLETIVPVGGIASWYEYQNSQGYRTGSDPSYHEWLASYCASRVHDGGWDQDRYGAYLNSMAEEQEALNGDYGTHYERRDYTLNPNLHCSALIVHGLNDDNVRSKNMQLMYDAFTDAGCNVKLLLHQDGHVTPAYGENKTEQLINGEAYQDVLNRWFSHYLFDEPNGAEHMAAVTVQDNYDAQQWHLYDSFDAQGVMGMSTRNRKISKETTIMGTIPVTVQAVPSTSRQNNLLRVRLVDTAGSNFQAYRTSSTYVNNNHRTAGTFRIGGGAEDYELVELRGYQTKKKVIAEGWMDLANPSAGFASSTAVRETVQAGREYTYTVYLQANVYRVAPGHTLTLEIIAPDSTVRSFRAEIPVVEKSPVTYSVEYQAGAHGSVISDIPSGQSVKDGTDVTLTAVPDPGYEFDGWTINGVSGTGEAVQTFTIHQNTVIEAKFRALPTEPETQPTEPETQPTEPETQPTEPETQPTEPETQPTEPEQKPSKPGRPGFKWPHWDQLFPWWGKWW